MKPLWVGQIYLDFFTDWVNGVGTPSYGVEWNNTTSNTITFKLTQTRGTNSNVTYFRMPVVLKVTGTSGASQTIVLYDNAGNLSLSGNGTLGSGTGTNKITLSIPFTPSSVQFDPGNVTVATGTVTFNSGLTQRISDEASAEEDSALKIKTSIYPNPSPSTFTLNIDSSDKTTPVEMYIVNVLGAMVEYKESILLNQNISFGNALEPGVYFIHLNQGKEQQSVKIVKH